MKKKENKKIVLFGLGDSGESALKYYNKNFFDVLVWDDNKNVRKNFKTKFPKIIIKNLKDINWKKVKYLLASPGIDLKNKSLNIVKKFKIPIFRDLEIFSQELNYKKILAVTGTNGKSTTVSLIGNLIFQKNKNIFIGGNLKPPLFDALLKKKYNKYIIEVSSFQLESAPSFESQISILLNISEDHIDRHGSLRQYVFTKRKIFNTSNNNQYSIIGIDDQYSYNIYKYIKKVNKNTIPISINKKIRNGIYFENRKIIDNYFNKNFIDLNRVNSNFFIDNNKQNILATYVVSNLLNYKKELFIKTIKKFKTLDHRSQILIKTQKLLVINDSKATNLSSALNTLQNNKNIHLIMGGQLKNKKFDKLFSYKNKIRKIYLIGESAKYIKKQINDYIKCEISGNMSIAVKNCFKDIKKINNFSTILLAPACSSFDQYKNYEERGIEFIHFINKYKNITINE